jgi:murein L,D-transpeptidase YafK
MKFQKLINTIFLALGAILLFSFFSKPSFLNQQLKFSRVKEAYNQKHSIIISNLKKLNVKSKNLKILFIGYKKEKVLEIYVRNSSGIFTLYHSFKMCAQSGELGPKYKAGDDQTPEGFYYIDRFNPFSNFHLSLGINYPNQADKKRSNASNLGGDIFIHGNCVSIGCMAMTDNTIKEIYILSVMAKNAGQNKIPVIIAPFKFHDPQNSNYINSQDYQSYSNHFKLWNSIKSGIETYKKSKKSPEVTIDKVGNYQIK